MHNLKNSLGFLTRIPVKIEGNNMSALAQHMWNFPIIGLLTGISAGFFGLLLHLVFPPFLVGFLVLAFLLLTTGAHHTDGLFDLGDGLMIVGPADRKIAAMHDISIGVGGMVLGFLVLMLTGISLSYSTNFLFLGIIFAEINAKYALHVACCFGPSAKTTTAHDFILHNTKRDVIKSTVLVILMEGSLLLPLFFINFSEMNSQFFNLIYSGVFSLGAPSWIILLLIGGTLILTIMTSLVLIILACHNFSGLTGDVLGALHEITRLVILLAFVLLI